MLFKRKKEQHAHGTGAEERKSPLRADEQEAPQPERPVNPEKDEQAEPERRHPSQAEGERESR
jgi:hypothetical protein